MNLRFTEVAEIALVVVLVIGIGRFSSPGGQQPAWSDVPRLFPRVWPFAATATTGRLEAPPTVEAASQGAPQQKMLSSTVSLLSAGASADSST